MWKIRGRVQNYLWGKKGQSEVREIYALNHGLEMAASDDDKEYAEFWLGDHPNGRALVYDPASEKWVDFPSDEIRAHGVQKLRFLFKILSIGNVLSIQAHPTKTLAERLFKEFPNVYKDPNHKPELAIALETGLKAFIGFRPMKEIQAFAEELLPILGKDPKAFAGNDGAVSIRKVVQYLVDNEDEILNKMESVHKHIASKSKRNGSENMFLKLYPKHKNDVGLVVILILNYVELAEGESILIPPSTPHAYIEGEIIECMAASDNVIRLGLTPKYKDKKTLVEMLDYDACGRDYRLVPRTDADGLLVYDTGKDFAKDFFVNVITGPVKGLELEHEAIALVLDGNAKISGKDAKKGDSYFILPSKEGNRISFESADSSPFRVVVCTRR